jgi:ribonuclease HII
MLICGIDEAGRGTLAGSLFLVGVVLHQNIPDLRDSKKLSPKKRETLYTEIVKNSTFHIFRADSKSVDELGISEVLRRGLEEILKNIEADRYIFDGNRSFGVDGVETLIGGDDLVPEISASSILAKVSKDREMVEFGEIYPQWGFEKHKGYGTKAHIEAIEKFGNSPIHRESFKVKKLMQKSLEISY